MGRMDGRDALYDDFYRERGETGDGGASAAEGVFEGKDYGSDALY